MDGTSLWVLIQQHKERGLLLLCGILLFLAGWQLGRVMSPYYASNPIVFSEAPASAPDPAAGSIQELAALQQAGQALAAASPAATSSASPLPTVAAAQDVVPATSPTVHLFAASVNSDKYHHKDCSSVKRIKEENLVWFATSADAEKAGYQPSVCAQGYIK